ncbi:MAG: HEPN domain-containing protein [Candidatus Rokubacteria bacterium]|nr:HEPN domain-containing protein [Candidatus Rokubacteria bacterium]
MPPDPVSRDVASEWLRYARGNLARAKQEKPAETPWEYMCFDAQQAAEKAIKAVLIFHGIELPRTHAIGELLDLLNRTGEAVPGELWPADALSDYATHARYPGGEQPVTEVDHERAVTLAEQVVRWAEGIVHGA